MKKLLIALCMVFLVFSGCQKDKDEIDQLTFTLTNMTTLINKSPGYIKEASPGVYDEDNSESDFLVFTYDEIATLGDLLLGYSITSDKCDDIIMLAESEELDAVDYLMSMAEDEFGTGELYGLSYYDEDEVLQEQTFSSYDDLWLYVDDYLITEANIETILAGYTYEGFIILTGGIMLEGFFWPMVDITSEDARKSTGFRNHVDAMRDQLQKMDIRKP
jgi:hypothetical protein